MDRDVWKSFLKRWSEEWLDARGVPEPRSAFEEPITDRWLGFPPASVEDVAAAEARLGCALPPSFREFLLVTDGWRNAGAFVDQLRDTSEIGWLRDLDPKWADIYDDIYEDVDEADEPAVLRRALLISMEADAGILFLDPGDVDESGEWAAYKLFSWSGSGPRRHESFYELMYDLYAGFHSLDRPGCETQREWDAKIEQARLASLAGELDGPLAVLEEAARFGRDRAEILRFQMLAMLGSYDASRKLGYVLSHGETLTWRLDATFLKAEILPLLFAEHERTDPVLTQSTLALLMGYGSEPVKRLIADYRAETGEPGFRARFGDEEFDAAVRAAITDVARGDAWPLLREALSKWRPLSDDHLAPISLLADPRIAELITPERGREILTMRRG
ncbi:SMI1/KNR4 family protein [Sphaerimonospora thailandensis]|uniref:SMI1/KNR4 family protein n=1 Tax=Sphaerimonospora thailandensis TaxID=795644 RepID=UPI00194F285C|nr:SMI1/KNR4 family protein [Sphaerimonospora thailandensis]